MTKISRERALGLVKNWSAKRSHISAAFVLADGFGFMAGRLSMGAEVESGIALVRTDEPEFVSVQVMIDFARVKGAFLASREEMAQETLVTAGLNPETVPSLVGSCVRLELSDSSVVLFLWEELA
jgi:hypothetical protein